MTTSIAAVPASVSASWRKADHAAAPHAPAGAPGSVTLAKPTLPAQGRVAEAASPALRSTARPGALMTVIGFHGVLAAAFFFWAPVHSKPKAVRPVQLSIIAAPTPAKPLPPKSLPALAQANPLPFTPKVPVVAVMPEFVPVMQETRTATAAPVREEPARALPVAAAAAPPAVAEPSPSANPKQLPPSAVRYVREPSLTVPLQSRRLGESGVVHLRIVVDAQGQLKEAGLKKSSGFARLDQQALHDIRSARFAPYLENGRAIEWETTALLSYESEK